MESTAHGSAAPLPPPPILPTLLPPNDAVETQLAIRKKRRRRTKYRKKRKRNYTRSERGGRVKWIKNKSRKSKMRKQKTKKRRKKRRRKSRKKRRRKQTNRGGGPGTYLPPGWKEHWSTRLERPYYFHAATGRSVWERQEIMDVDEGSGTPSGQSRRLFPHVHNPSYIPPLFDGLLRTSPVVWGAEYAGDQHTAAGAEYAGDQHTAAAVAGAEYAGDQQAPPPPPAHHRI